MQEAQCLAIKIVYDQLTTARRSRERLRALRLVGLSSVAFYAGAGVMSEIVVLPAADIAAAAEAADRALSACIAELEAQLNAA